MITIIYLTGDTHGSLDIHKLSTKEFPQQKEMTKNDYIIILGDFGLIWNGSQEELFWRKWLNDKNFTTLFIDGNHEGFHLLNQFPVTQWNGGNVHMIEDSIIHLMRGQVFTIDNNTFFTMGGATSIDKHKRKDGVSWWKEELPSYFEYAEGLVNLDKYNWNVDYVLTHAAPSKIFDILKYGMNKDCLTDYFETLEEKLNFKHWYCGHIHDDISVDKYSVLYDNVVKL